MSASVKDATVAALLSYYDAQVRKFNVSPFNYRHYRPGENISHGMLWQKLVQITTWCQARSIPPIDFVRAQFECWRTPSNPKARGIGYPTPRFIGLTEANLARYEQWQQKKRSLATATVETASTRVEETIASFRSHRPDLQSDEDFFRDPFLLRQLDPVAVRTHPIFRKVVEEGAYPEGSFAREMVKEYVAGVC